MGIALGIDFSWIFGRFTRFATRAAAVLADYELEANILIQLGPLICI